jgi:hypothetical protein
MVGFWIPLEHSVHCIIVLPVDSVDGYLAADKVDEEDDPSPDHFFSHQHLSRRRLNTRQVSSQGFYQV